MHLNQLKHQTTKLATLRHLRCVLIQQNCIRKTFCLEWDTIPSEIQFHTSRFCNPLRGEAGAGDKSLSAHEPLRPAEPTEGSVTESGCKDFLCTTAQLHNSFCWGTMSSTQEFLRQSIFVRWEKKRGEQAAHAFNCKAIKCVLDNRVYPVSRHLCPKDKNVEKTSGECKKL